ncbi:MAG: hypothetical protein L6R42_001177 [Xanthoria sp. 1 TBL-2021]|nr:MAG: hypothetical protein L6R42_001177 [Xanthoria sp. 1 TBL-2021]
MPSVQDGLKSRNIANDSNRKAGPAPYAEKDLLPPPDRKRKYHELENPPDIWDSFIIKQTQQDAATDAPIFRPRLLLPRGHLPLAYLDTSGTAGYDQKIKLFSAQIPVLETACQGDQADTLPLVLITESSGESLYAVERVQHGIYAQCKLARWIGLKHLEVLQDLGTHHVTPPERPYLGKTDHWWQGIGSHNRREGSPSIIQPDTSSYHKTRCDLRKPAYISTEPTPSLKDVPSTGRIEPPSVVTKGGNNPPSQEPPLSSWEHSLQTPDDLLKSIKTQYKELLYRSKASLAYFAKGPLSRARAGFSDDNDGPASRRCLVEHLRALIIPLDLLDKKYRVALPCLVKDLPSANISDDERHEVAAKYKKSTRKSKKERIGKNGLYPEEELDVLGWWLNCIASAPAHGSPELLTQAANARILEQRTRETFLQIILVLEVLALESTQPNHSVDQSLDKEPRESELPEEKGKRKKPQDLGLLLELSVDRLCIWQSMAVEKDDSSEKIDDVGRGNTGLSSSNKKQDINRLREFCVDVVLPFYTARLPLISRSLCKKLGGPSSHSPARLAPNKVGSASLKPPKPGAAVKRSQPRQPRRTLERVLTDDRTSQKPLPRLFRSATDSVVPSLKREPSEILLSKVPVAKPDHHLSKRYSQREVDLTAVSQAKEAKVKKKAELEQELKGAIAALKRPNPRMAVKELVESAERRATGAKSRKPRHPVRNPFAQSVQIMATPSANRRRDVYASQTSQLQKSAVIAEDVEEIPPSSCLRVPASTTKLLADPQAKSNSAEPRRYLLPTVEQTPTRGPSKFSKLNNISNASPSAAKQAITTTSSWLMAAEPQLSIPDTSRKHAYQLPSSRSGVQGTPSRRTSTGPKGSLPRSGIESTPVKSSKTVSANLAVISNNITSSPMPKGGDVSIYESLGWDDVDELM